LHQPTDSNISRDSKSIGSASGSTDSSQRCYDSEVDRWGLKHAKAYLFSNQGGIFVIRDVSDVKALEEVRHAMTTLDFSEREASNVFDIAASVLHVGEVSFAEDLGYGSVVEDEWSQSSARRFCELTGVDFTALIAALTTKDVSTKSETVIKPLRPIDAVEARDALAKALYSRLFDWLVAKINRSLGTDDPRAIQASANVLDIFGFECFEENSLEQLCINYTNEKLQQHFNNYVFKLEEEEYTREGIEWSFIDFPDNQDILNLIEGKKPLGILTLLDDECNNPSGSDKNFTFRIYKSFLGEEMDELAANTKMMRRASTGGIERAMSPSFGFLGDKSDENSKHPRFDATRLMKPRGKFSIVHYAGSVTYSAEGFWAKNRDEFPVAARELLQRSTNPFVKHLFKGDDGGNETVFDFETLDFDVDSSNKLSSGMRQVTLSRDRVDENDMLSPRNGKQPLKTVAKKFQAQLADLMARLSATQPHYIRCLKPNDGAEPFVFNQRRVAEQLRYGGVLEAVRVSRSGFPVRMPHWDFYYRYRRLVLGHTLAGTNEKENTTNFPLSIKGGTAPEVVESLTRTLTKKLLEVPTIFENEKYKSESVQFGKTKIFLRKEAHDALEARVLNSRLRAATQVQATSRRILAMKNYFLKVSAIRLLQRCLRGYHGRLLAAHARKCLESAITLQSFARGNRARSMVKLIRRDRAVLRIQKVFRGKPSLWLFIRLRKAMISVQCAVRVKKSAILRKHLAVEAKSLQTLQRKNEELAAQLVKQKERDDELQRQEAIYTMEKARADAETARQKQADRVLRRVLIRFKHSVPLAGAMQVWTRATRMAAAIAEENKRQSMRLEAELKQIEESHNNSKKQEQAILILGAWAQSSKIKRLQQYWMRVRLFVASEKAMEERDQAKRATEKESSRAGKLADQIETLQHELHALETEGATVESELKFAALELEKKVKILEDSAVLSESVHNEERSAAEFKQNGLLDELELTKARADALEKALQEEQNAKESEGAAHEREVEEHRAVVEKLKDTESELASQAEKCALLESQALETKALREIGDADAMNTERELRSKIAELEEALRKEHESRLADHAKAGEEVESVKAKLIESENLLSAERAERDSDNRKLVANVLESNHKTLKRIEDFGQSLHQAEDENALTQAFSEADAKFDALKRALLDSEDKVSCKNVEHDLGYEALGEKMEEMSNEVSTRVRGLVDSLRTESACRADIEQLRMVETTRAVEALNSVNAAFKKADEALTSEEAGNAFGSITIIEKIEKLSLEASDRMNDLENLLATEKTTRAELEELRTADHALSESTIDSLKETLQSLEGKKLSLSITEERLNADIESLKHENAQLDGELLKMKDQLASSEIALSHEAARAKAAGSEAESLIQELKAKLVTVEDAIISETEARATAEEGTMRISTECESLKSSLAGVELELQEERTNRSADNETHQAEIEKSEIALQEMVSQVKVLEEKVSKDQAEQETEATRVSHALQEWESKCTSLEDTLNQERLDRASERGDDQELIDYLRNEVAEVKLDLSKEQEDLKVMRREAKERAQSIQALSDEAEKRIQELNDSLKEEETKKAELALDLQRKIEFEESLSAKLDELEQSLVHEKELRLAADEMSDATARSMREAVEGLESRLAQDEEDKARWAEEVEQSSFAAAKRIQELEDVLEEGEYRRVEFELEAQHKEEDLAELRHHLADVEAKLSAALAAVAAIEDPAITAAKISALEDEVAAEKAARQADQSEAQAKEEQLEQTLRSVRDEALLKGNQLPELIARVESLDEALAKERAGRAEDVKVHQATHAAVEARSKQATDELRSQVGALMEAMSKERTVRAKQRSELDTKAAAAAATVDALKAKVRNRCTYSSTKLQHYSMCLHFLGLRDVCAPPMKFT
jgi:myosin-5